MIQVKAIKAAKSADEIMPVCNGCEKMAKIHAVIERGAILCRTLDLCPDCADGLGLKLASACDHITRKESQLTP